MPHSPSEVVVFGTLPPDFATVVLPLALPLPLLDDLDRLWIVPVMLGAILADLQFGSSFCKGLFFFVSSFWSFNGALMLLGSSPDL